MKRPILLLLLLLSAVPASSQVEPPPRPGPPRVRMIDRWTKDLGLSAAQRAKIDGIFKSTSAQTKQILGNKKLSREQQRERVTKLHQNRRAYGVLHDELDTRPRTRYLSKLRNPVEVASGDEGDGKHGEPAPAGAAHEG